MFARIKAGIVAELFPEKPVLHPDLMATINPCTDTTSVGDTFDGTTYASPPAQPVADVASRKSEQLGIRMAADLALGYTCTNNITMQATNEHVRRLDDGHRLAARLSATTMDVRDITNVRHMGMTLSDVETMVNELGANWLTLWSKKCSLQEDVQAVVDDLVLTDDEKRAAIQSIS